MPQDPMSRREGVGCPAEVDVEGLLPRSAQPGVADEIFEAC